MIRVAILGCGPAGLIAAMKVREVLRGFAEITIFDRAPAEDIRSPKVKHPFFVHEDIGAKLGVPLKEVRVRESVRSGCQPSDWARLYSMSTTGILTENVMTDFTGPVRVRTAWYSAELVSDLFARVYALNCDFEFYTNLAAINKVKEGTQIVTLDGRMLTFDVVINTIPMPFLLSTLHEEVRLPILGDAKFKTENMVIGYVDRTDDGEVNKLAEIIYDPRGTEGWIRFGNIFGNITIEFHRKVDIERFARTHGKARLVLPEVYESLIPEAAFQYAKLGTRFIPIDEQVRRSIVYKLTSKMNIFSIGRFATWSYKRVDHLPADAHAIARMIDKKLQAKEFDNA